jgi:glycerophosphoryl diester phosphodiesterase
LYENLEKIRSVLPEQPVQFLCFEITDGWIEKLAAARIDVDVHYGALNEENVKKIHAAGLKINCWTVDSPDDAEKLATIGVDFITSNILE